MSTQTVSHPRSFSQLLGRALRAPVRLQTYRNLFYFVLMFPLGLLYFTFLTAGFAVAIPLLIVLIGLPVIVMLLVIASKLAALERTLVSTLLGIDIPTITPDSTVASGSTSPPVIERGSLWDRTKQRTTDLRTWKAIGYLFSEYFYVSVVIGLLSPLLATGGSFLLAPLYYTRASVVAYGPSPTTDVTLEIMFGWDALLVGLTTTFQLGSWQIETLSGALLVAGFGIVLLLFSFQILNALAWVWGRYARVMLTPPV